jgi:hypothetical protein
MNIFKTEISVTEIDKSQGIVYGWGMITDINGEPYYDLDNLHTPADIMVKATSEFMETARVSNDSHTPLDIGIVVHSFPLSNEIAKAMGITSNINGWMVGVKPDADTLAKFVSGEYTGFSIEGTGSLTDDEVQS